MSLQDEIEELIYIPNSRATTDASLFDENERRRDNNGPNRNHHHHNQQQNHHSFYITHITLKLDVLNQTPHTHSNIYPTWKYSSIRRNPLPNCFNNYRLKLVIIIFVVNLIIQNKNKQQHKKNNVFITKLLIF